MTPEERARELHQRLHTLYIQGYPQTAEEDVEIYDVLLEALNQAETAARAEVREACAKAIDLFQDIIGWQEGESRNALVCEIRDSIRNHKD